MWPFSKEKEFFSKEENEMIVQAIRDAEQQTSGEVRIYIESRCRFIDPLDRAKEIFLQLKMENTHHRNGVLFYVAIKDRQLAIFADSGIHAAAGSQYWVDVVKQILSLFDKENYAMGIKECISKIGHALKDHFPYERDADKNELPDEIIFGK
ncbi:MAG: TPM domain-containing protein [Ginsengibacter sp.]